MAIEKRERLYRLRIGVDANGAMNLLETTDEIEFVEDGNVIDAKQGNVFQYLADDTELQKHVAAVVAALPAARLRAIEKRAADERERVAELDRRMALLKRNGTVSPGTVRVGS